MALISGRRFGQGLILSYPGQEDVLIEFRHPSSHRDDLDVRVTADQSVTISNAERPRTTEDRSHEALNKAELKNDNE